MAPAKRAIPYLNELAQKYQGQIEVIGILGGSSRSDDDITFLKKYNVTFKVISEPQSSEDILAKQWAVFTVFLCLLFLRGWQRDEALLGLVPKSLLEETLKKYTSN